MLEADRLLADIGGTNARFALASAAEIKIHKTYAVRDYPQLIDALRAFIQETGQEGKIRHAALAVAGPVLNDRVLLTNSGWVCDRTEIERVCAIPCIHIVNDLEAVAWALADFDAHDAVTLQQGVKSSRHPMIVIGSGTGLGTAALIPCRGGWQTVATEAGHTRYAPANNDERHLIDRIARKHIFVTAEHLVSGPGLANIYHALGDDYESQACLPASVVAAARAGEPRARAALDMFAAILGSFASQTALTYNALGGIYLTGGVLQKIGADFAADRFLQRFATNPAMSNLLSRMPVLRVNADIPAFSGLQILLTQQFR